MYQLPRIFVLKKQSKKNMEDMLETKPKSKSMDLTQSPRKLVRRNAAKNFEYTPSASSSTSPSTSGSSAPRTRSLDLPHDLGTSFRVEGNEGELDMVYKSLGLNGPEDFEIPKADYELMKKKSSSDVIRRTKRGDIESNEPSVQRQEIKKFGEPPPHRFGNSIPSNTAMEAETDRVPSTSRTMMGNDQKQSGSTVVPLIRNVTGAVGRGGGINGVRPPLLTPPPAMSLPVLDSECSNWDLVSQFGPEDDRKSSFHHRADSSDDEEEVDEMNVDTDGAHGARIEEMSGSCSFTTTNDDDSSSTTTEPVSIISPDGGHQINITHWEKVRFLGGGSFGTVYEGISSEGKFFAVKEVSLLEQGSQGKQSIYQLEQEIELLSQFEHENIVRYLGTDKDDSKLYIFLELVTQGSLASLYHKYHLRDSHVSAYTRQILMGLKYLHEKNVVHRDIKCANILVASNGTVKLADFGLAKATRLNDLKSCKGTAFWMAPEVVNHKNHGYGLGADIWSLGCTVLEMLTRHVPYYPLECMQALYRIGIGKLPLIPDSLSADARDFIQQCLRPNPNDRPTAAELLDHSFVKRPLFTSLGSESPMRPVRSI